MIQRQSLSPADYPLPPQVTESVLTPALVIFLDQVRSNLQSLLQCADGDAGRFRPHLKTSKMPIVWAEMLAAGFRHFKCATVREAEVFLDVAAGDAGAGPVDLLIAQPLRGPALARVNDLARKPAGAFISILCEDGSVLDEVSSRVAVFIDINPGMNRTGVPLNDRKTILNLAQGCGQRLRGLHFYDGHIDTGSVETRREQAHAGYRELMELVNDLSARGIAVEEIITSGTPTFQQALSFEPFNNGPAAMTHRVSPGTVVLHDYGYAESFPELHFAPAALVLSRVVSHPAANLVTADAGSKSIAAEMGDPCAVALGWPNLIARKPNEEHLPFEVRGGRKPDRGQTLLLFPRHVCPTVNLADEAIVIENGEVNCIAPVSARGH